MAVSYTHLDVYKRQGKDALRFLYGRADSLQEARIQLFRRTVQDERDDAFPVLYRDRLEHLVRSRRPAAAEEGLLLTMQGGALRNRLMLTIQGLSLIHI